MIEELISMLKDIIEVLGQELLVMSMIWIELLIHSLVLIGEKRD
jgi:hypothetical protein